MPYEMSYDATLKMFRHDSQRGKWSTPTDFLYACLGHAFQIDAILIMPSIIFRDLGIYAIIPYLVVLAFCVVPLVFIQSFLGQFSSTGFISSFRIAPLYKGIGYVSLAVNLTTLMYVSIFGAIPLFFFFNSLRSVIPWTCERAKELIDRNENWTIPCAGVSAPIGSTHLEIPTWTFFWHHLNPMDLHRSTHPSGTHSWWLVICCFLIWTIVGTILIQRLEVVARFIRYSCLMVLGIMVLCIVRLAFLSGALNGLEELISTERLRLWDVWCAMPLLALSALGPGWGSIISMSSYNHFRTDIHKFSWMLCLAQFGVTIGLVLLSAFTGGVITELAGNDAEHKFVHSQWMENLMTPFALSHAGWPHFWSLLYFGMLTLGALNILTVHLLSVLTSVLDEFSRLREFKKEVIQGATAMFALTSIYFSSNYGLTLAERLAKFSMFTELFLNVLLIIAVLGVYGRERFQRDVHFMIDRLYPTYLVNIVRFIVPVLFLLLVVVIYEVSVTIGYTAGLSLLFVALITFIPWCLVPGYSIYTIMQTRGMLRMRIKRCAKPHDWYPANPDDRQRYEEFLNDSIGTEQLTNVNLN